MARINLRLFDISAQIESDVPEYFNYFRTLFAEMVCEPVQGELTYSLEKTVNGTLRYVTHERSWELVQGSVDVTALARHTATDMLRRVASHYLFHAGVVEIDGKGTAIVGPSQHGKTTLTMALVQNGAHILSDETLAIRRNEPVADAFLRHLNIRTPSFELLGLTPQANLARRPRAPISAAEFSDSRVVSDTPLHSVFFVSDHLNNAARHAQLELHFNHLPHSLVKAIAEHASILSCSNEAGVLTISAESLQTTYKTVEDVSAKHGAIILHVGRMGGGKPDFSQPAQIRPLNRIEATTRLLENYQGGYQSAALAKWHGGNTMHFFNALLQLLSPVRFYELKVGPLKQMTDLVTDAVTSEVNLLAQ